MTTDIALRGGVDFYNFPKFMAQIDFAETPERRRCRLAEGDEHILTLSGPGFPTPRTDQVDWFCRLWMDGQPQTALFKINRLQVGATTRRTAVIEIGERHPIAQALDRLMAYEEPGGRIP